LEGIYGVKRIVFLYKRQQPFILGGMKVKHKSKISNEKSRARLKDLRKTQKGLFNSLCDTPSFKGARVRTVQKS